MYEKYRCKHCGARLDPGEWCECQNEKIRYITEYNRIIFMEKDGQFIIREAIKC